MVQSQGGFVTDGMTNRYSPNQTIGPGVTKGTKPTASRKWFGQFILDDVGLWVCNSDGAGGYEWVFVGYGTASGLDARYDARYVNVTGDTMTGTLTGGMAAGNVAVDMSTNDNYVDMRVVRNSRNASDKILWLGYGAGVGGAVALFNNTTRRLMADGTGVTIDTLTGTGTRVVEASAAGLLSAPDLLGATLIDTFSWSAVASVTRDTKFTAAYDYYLLVAQIDSMVTAAQDFRFRYRVGGATDAGNYSYMLHWTTNVPGDSFTGGTTTSQPVIAGFGAGTWAECVGLWLIGNPASAARRTRTVGHIFGVCAGVAEMYMYSAGGRQASGAHDGIQILTSSGNFAGSGRIYGLR